MEKEIKSKFEEQEKSEKTKNIKARQRERGKINSKQYEIGVRKKGKQGADKQQACHAIGTKRKGKTRRKVTETSRAKKRNRTEGKVQVEKDKREHLKISRRGSKR